MPVTYLELENFKSYAGLQRIGPFHDFTCVVGPNGGKEALVIGCIKILFMFVYGPIGFITSLT